MLGLPERILRFYGNADYALETLALKHIAFIHVEKLNDPFDPWMRFITDFNDDYNRLSSWVHRNRPHKEKEFKSKLDKDNFIGLIEETRGKTRDFRESLYIFSACEVIKNNHPRENLYMWAHYANGHRGIALEFDARLLNDYFKKVDKHSQDLLSKIEYEDEIPQISCEDIYRNVVERDYTDFKRKLDKAAAIKSKVWKEEAEWRLLEQRNDTEMDWVKRKLPDNSVTAIYFGCRSDDQIRAKLIFEKKTFRLQKYS